MIHDPIYRSKGQGNEVTSQKQFQFCSKAHSSSRNLINNFTNIGVSVKNYTNSLRKYIYMYFPSKFKDLK